MTGQFEVPTMHFNLRNLALSLFLFFVTAVAWAADKTPEAASIVEIQKMLLETESKTSDLPKRMTLAKFLKALESRFPKDKKVSLSIDAAAFGKTLPQIAEAEIAVDRIIGLNLSGAMKMALIQVKGEFDVAIRPGAVTVTLPRQSAYAMTYDVRGLLRRDQLLAHLMSETGELYPDVEPSDKMALLARCLANQSGLRSWETLEELNRTQFRVVASLARQEEIAGLLDNLQTVADWAVVMNARLYEVDRQFFAQHVAPLIPKDQDTGKRPIVRRIDGLLFKKIAQQELLATNDLKVEPGKSTHFLSKHSVLRYAAGPRPDADEWTGVTNEMIGTCLAGVSFEVRPLISHNRTELRLDFTQKVSQLVALDKSKMLDVTTGKKIEVESPNLRKSTLTGVIEVPDNCPVLLQVGYRPGGDKVWLLLARPYIWIKEEMEELRGLGGDDSPKAFWEMEVAKEVRNEALKLAPAKRLPADNDVKEVLLGVLQHALTDPFLKQTRQLYGSPRDKTFTLVDGEKLGWPEGFRPEVNGFKLVEVKRDRFVEQHRVLGIRIDQFHEEKMADGSRNAAVWLCLFNAGGAANGGVVGGCSATFSAKLVGKTWKVKCLGLDDP